METKELLKKLTGQKNIFLISRGNNAIRQALQLVKTDRKNILVQDQGGWLRYLDYPQKYGFTVEMLKTDFGIVDLEDLEKKAKKAAAILYEDPAGYIAEQPIKEVYEICQRNGCEVILDITGSIGYRNIGEVADYVIASFGSDKPVNLGYGGVVATNKDVAVKEDFESDEKELLESLNKLSERQRFLHQKSYEIKQELKEHNIIHRDSSGINVVVAFESKEEKGKIIDYCKKNGLPYTTCPRYIRVMRDAVSIEIKKLI